VLLPIDRVAKYLDIALKALALPVEARTSFITFVLLWIYGRKADISFTGTGFQTFSATSTLHSASSSRPIMRKLRHSRCLLRRAR